MTKHESNSACSCFVIKENPDVNIQSRRPTWQRLLLYPARRRACTTKDIVEHFTFGLLVEQVGDYVKHTQPEIPKFADVGCRMFHMQTQVALYATRTLDSRRAK